MKTNEMYLPCFALALHPQVISSAGTNKDKPDLDNTFTRSSPAPVEALVAELDTSLACNYGAEVVVERCADHAAMPDALISANKSSTLDLGSHSDEEEDPAAM
jgi:hypothetical protein